MRHRKFHVLHRNREQHPTIDGGRTRIDEMQSGFHYARWQEDFALVQELGLEFLRYGPPLHRVLLGPGRYDWEFADLTFADLKRRNIMPIVDLCHFGVPDWLGNFQNPDFPAQFCAYARAFAQRFPRVQLYTPVNEMYVCAVFSARYGWWNEQLSSEQAFEGFVSYTVASTDGGGISVTTCQDQAGIDESVKKAKDFIAKHAANTGLTAPEVSTGKVILHLK